MPYNPAWLDDLELSPSEFRVYLHVARRSNGGRVACTAGVAGIAAVCRLHVDTVRVSLRLLAAKGLLSERAVPGKGTERRPLPRIRGGNPSLRFGGVGKETPTSDSARPLPPFRPDPPETRGDEGAVEGAFEGIQGSPAARPAARSRSKRSKARTTTTATAAGKVLEVEVLPAGDAGPWSREACDDWREAMGGTPPGGRIGRALKPLVAEHGWNLVRPVWRRYLASKDGKYGAEHFASRFGIFAQGGDGVAARSARALARWAEDHEADPAQPLSDVKAAAR